MFRDENAQRREDEERRREGCDEVDPWFGHNATDVTYALHPPVPRHSSHPSLACAPDPCYNRTATDVTSQVQSRPNSPGHDYYYGKQDSDVTAHLQVSVPKSANPHGCKCQRYVGKRYNREELQTSREAHSHHQRAFDYMHPLGTHRPFPLSGYYYHSGSKPSTPCGSRSHSPSRCPRSPSPGGVGPRSRDPNPGGVRPRSPSPSPGRIRPQSPGPDDSQVRVASRSPSPQPYASDDHPGRIRSRYRDSNPGGFRTRSQSPSPGRLRPQSPGPDESQVKVASRSPSPQPYASYDHPSSPGGVGPRSRDPNPGGDRPRSPVPQSSGNLRRGPNGVPLGGMQYDRSPFGFRAGGFVARGGVHGSGGPRN